MHPIETIHFQAQWTEENRHLQREEPCCFSLKDTLGSLVGRVIVPGAHLSSEIRREVEREWEDFVARSSSYRIYRLSLTTPDEVRIEGAFYRSLKTLALDIPTFMVFMANRTLSQELPLCNPGLFMKGTPHHVVSFDYGQTCRPQDLLLAAETVYQWVRESISEDHLIYYGRSLGGAVAALHRQMRPSQAPLISSHSFSTLENLIVQMDTDKLELPEAHSCLDKLFAFFYKCLGYITCLKTIVVWLLRYTEWDFAGVPAALQSIGPQAHVIFDPHDGLIQDATAAQCVPQDQVIVVNSPGGDRHNMPTEFLQDQQGIPVTDRIMQLIPQPSALP